MVKYTYIHHQFSLMDYNALRPRLIIPMRRISKKRYDQALAELRAGKKRGMLEILEDVNEALEKFDKRLTNGKTNSKAVRQ